MTGGLDRRKRLLYNASVHLLLREGDMDQTGQNIIDAAMELVVERGYTAFDRPHPSEWISMWVGSLDFSFWLI